MCMFCKCDTVKQSTTTHVVNYKNSIIVIKNVPCEECEPVWRKVLYRRSSWTVRKDGWFSKANDAGNCSVRLFKGSIKR